MVRGSPRFELAAGDWLTVPLRLREADQGAAIQILLDTYQRLPDARTEAFLEWLATATGSGRADQKAASSTWMTWDMVREMRRGGMAFGAHTVNHPVLIRCPADRQELMPA